MKSKLTETQIQELVEEREDILAELDDYNELLSMLDEEIKLEEDRQKLAAFFCKG